jgi:hypothetical protein
VHAACACGLCKPQKRGWMDKKTPADMRAAYRDAEQMSAAREGR